MLKAVPVGLAAFFLSLGMGQSVAAATTVGIDNSENCIPFGCGPTSIYQQIYAATAFSKPITISSFSFFEDDMYKGGSYISATYDVRFYLSSAPVGGLSDTASDNRGALLSDFGSFSLSGSILPETIFDGQDFIYDPAAGNLLVEFVTASRMGVGGTDNQFAADRTGTVTSRLSDTDHSRTGLVTRFNEPSETNSGVPEPATWAMMFGGFAAIGAAKRRRQFLQGAFRFASIAKEPV